MILMYLLLVAIGLYALIKGADFLIDNSTKIAKIYNIPEYVIGLTIVAMGTSLPELIVSVTAALKGSSDIALANVAGSNIANILLILGVAMVLKPILVEKKLLKNDLVYALGSASILAILAFYAVNFNFSGSGFIGKTQAIILLISFFAYLTLVFISSRKSFTKEEKAAQENTQDKKENIKYFGLILVGLILMMVGANVSVDNAVKLAQDLGMSERLIGLTVIAIGTSLPELVATIQAVRKNAYGLILGNILGSNIYNALFIVGVAAFISPIQITQTHLIDLFLGVFIVVLIYVLNFVFKKFELSRKEGVILLLVYALYYVHLFNGEYNFFKF